MYIYTYTYIYICNGISWNETDQLYPTVWNGMFLSEIAKFGPSLYFHGLHEIYSLKVVSGSCYPIRPSFQ